MFDLVICWCRFGILLYLFILSVVDLLLCLLMRVLFRFLDVVVCVLIANLIGYILMFCGFDCLEVWVNFWLVNFVYSCCRMVIYLFDYLYCWFLLSFYWLICFVSFFFVFEVMCLLHFDFDRLWYYCYVSYFLCVFCCFLFYEFC